MVLDWVYLGRKPLAGKLYGEQVCDALSGAPVLEAIEDEPEVWAMYHQISKLAVKIGPVVLVDGDVLDISKSNARFPKAISDRLRRKASPVFHTTKSLLFRGR